MSNPNGVANITEKIMAEATLWAEEQTAAATEEAAAITAQWEKEAKEACERILFDARVKASATAQRAKGQSEMDQRKMLLFSRQACLQEAFDLALEKLCALPDDKKIAMMVAAGKRYQTADGEYIFNAADKSGIGPKIVAQLGGAHKATLSERTGNFAGGFILKQGDVEVNFTFEVLIGGMREELEGETASILFG